MIAIQRLDRKAKQLFGTSAFALKCNDGQYGVCFKPYTLPTTLGYSYKEAVASLNEIYQGGDK